MRDFSLVGLEGFAEQVKPEGTQQNLLSTSRRIGRKATPACGIS
jgi:hypothetical protein